MVDNVVDSLGVHLTHCCVFSCKYGDEDCPVATGKYRPTYKCEDCSCLAMNVGSDKLAEEWWANLSPAQKARIYLTQDFMREY